jgi:hypothetical protein
MSFLYNPIPKLVRIVKPIILTLPLKPQQISPKQYATFFFDGLIPEGYLIILSILKVLNLRSIIIIFLKTFNLIIDHKYVNTEVGYPLTFLPKKDRGCPPERYRAGSVLSW